MIYCIRFVDFTEFVTGLGFVLDDESERTFAYVRGDEVITVRRPNAHGDITEAAANDALDAADIDPPVFSVHWCD